MEKPGADQRVARLLRETGEAHHDAFLLTEGVDSEWPSWYAQYLQPRLKALFDEELTRSELVYHLVAASKEHEREAPDSEWSDFYARVLVERLSTRSD